ncbi:MAG TPA: hypothetical protein VI072_04300 [Polyangiaceae bacterium]
MLRVTPFGLAFTFVALSFSCSDDNKSEFDGGSGGSSAAGGNAGVGGTLLPPPDGGGARDGGGGARPNTPVDVIITADNAYGFGYGTGSALLNYFGGIENPGTDDIFACPVGHGPEKYEVPASDANAGNYLYIIGYADKLTTQGVIAKFSREGADPVYTGMGPWEACATGLDYELNQNPKGPTRAIIDEYIGRCNRKELPENSSKGWVTTTQSPNGSVAFGEDNSTERTDVTPQNPFKIACDIEPSARWMWYDWDPSTDQSPFIWPGGSANTAREFIIFRLGAEFIPEPPPE